MTPYNSHNYLEIVKVIFTVLSLISSSNILPQWHCSLKFHPSLALLECSWPEGALKFFTVPHTTPFDIFSHCAVCYLFRSIQALDKLQASLAWTSQDRTHAWKERKCAEWKNDHPASHKPYTCSKVCDLERTTQFCNSWNWGVMIAIQVQTLLMGNNSGRGRRQSKVPRRQPGVLPSCFFHWGVTCWRCPLRLKQHCWFFDLCPLKEKKNKKQKTQGSTQNRKTEREASWGWLSWLP